MATAQQPAAATNGPAEKGSNKKALFFTLLAILIVCGPFAIIPLANMGDDDVDTDVRPPTATERTDTVPILRKAFESQGVCYGWRLTDGYGGTGPVSVGSNLGDGIPAADHPQCPRWVEIVADVVYYSDSSESEDYASVAVEGSSDFRPTDLILVERGLERFNLTPDAFVDDPGWAVTRAAVTLPLLVAERDKAEFAPVGTAAPATPPAALPDAGNDVWRDRWGWRVGAGAMLLITALLVTVGLVQRRRQRRAASAAVPAPRAGEDAPARTPGRA